MHDKLTKDKLQLFIGANVLINNKYTGVLHCVTPRTSRVSIVGANGVIPIPFRNIETIELIDRDIHVIGTPRGEGYKLLISMKDKQDFLMWLYDSDKRETAGAVIHNLKDKSIKGRDVKQGATYYGGRIIYPDSFKKNIEGRL